MLARLWWKEARLTLPIGIFVILMAIVLEAMELRYGFIGVSANRGIFIPFAFLWSGLYGLVVAAGLFAGERENRTLTLLDTMGVGRWLLWSSKLSFAILTTLAVAAILIVAAILGFGIQRWPEGQWGTSVGGAIVIGGFFLLEVIGLGVFWSAILSSALTAAVLGGFSVCVLLPIVLSDSPILVMNPGIYIFLTSLIGVSTITLSGAILIWPQRHRQQQLGYRLVATSAQAAPISVARSDSSISWWFAARSLVWQTYREARGFWLISTGILLFLLILSFGAGVNDNTFREFALLVLIPIAGIVAGVNVFGTENRGRTQRFLVSHGVGSAIVWGVKLASWSMALGLIAIQGQIIDAAFHRFGILNGPLDLQLYFAGFLTCFAVAQFCGMLIRRSITAFVVAVAGTIVVCIPQMALLQALMVPGWGLFLLPACLFAITFLGSRDWLLETPGSGRWIRLGLSIAGAMAILFGSFVTYRVVSVPTAEPLGETYNAPSAIIPTPHEGNAADLYLEAIKDLDGVLGADIVTELNKAWNPAEQNPPMWNPADRQMLECLKNKRTIDVLDKARKAALIRTCDFTGRVESDLFSQSVSGMILRQLETLAQLLMREARVRQANENLQGAWEDIQTVIRLGQHLAGNAPIHQAQQAGQIEEGGIRLAMAWAFDSKQTPELLRAKLKAWQEGFGAVSPTETLRAEWQLIHRTLDLPGLSGDILTSGLPKSVWHMKGDEALKRELYLATMPWEIVRARRVFRLLFLAGIEMASHDPSQYPRMYPRMYTEAPSSINAKDKINANAPFVDFFSKGQVVWRISRDELLYLQKSTPLVDWLMPNLEGFMHASDRVEVVRRALPQILALRAWQLTHDGHFPEQLAMLIPSELDRLPKDPYSNEPFQYELSRRRIVVPITWPSNWRNSVTIINSPFVTSTEDQWVLSSIGSDMVFANEPILRQPRPSPNIDFPLPREAWRPPPKPPADPEAEKPELPIGPPPIGEPIPLPQLPNF